MEEYETGAIFVLIGLVALLMFTTGYFATAYEEQKDKTSDAKRAAVIVKIDEKSSKKRVVNIFKNRFKFSQAAQNDVVWMVKGQKVSQSEIFLAYGINKENQQSAFIDAMFKAGNKRFIQSCNQIYAPHEVWSLGYCTLEPFPKEGVA